ncbi:MAG: argininosuccinate lyase [Planctomycetes bacterium]|nr:argininosuccinate lyase [Planctomycetota bacterium]
MSERGPVRGGKGLLRGRFSGEVHPALDRINRSLPVDVRLWREDVDGSVAHAEMLGARGILSKAAARRIVAGLRRVRRELESGTFVAKPGDEDVHMAVERRLTELVGPDGGRLHTARSRNDQVATDVWLYLGRASARAAARVRDVQRALVRLARRDGDAILPAYTHLQRGQPVLLGHHLLAYVEMLARDHDRLLTVTIGRPCPLGSGACTGVSYPIDRRRTARALGGPATEPSANSLDAVSSRDTLTEWVYAAAQAAVTLSRLGEDLVLWTTREFGFARLGDAVSTGSSIMPQKRNPDGAELLRAKCARVTGDLVTLLGLQKGLPLGYNKDLQEDKAALFDAEDQLSAMLDVARAMLEDVRFDRARMRAAVTEASGYLLATEAADWLAKRGVPFREAHRAVGALVRAAEERHVALEALPLDVFRAAHPCFDRTVYRALTPEAAVAARTAVGGTAPENVERELARWEAHLDVRRRPARGH